MRAQRRAVIAQLGGVSIAFLLLLFGPKLSGVFDTSVAGGALLVLMAGRGSRLSVSSLYRSVVLWILLLTAYSGLVFMLSAGTDGVVVLRMFRALLTTALLGLALLNCQRWLRIPARRLIQCLVLILLVNALVVIVGALWPTLQVSLAGLYGFDKTIRFGRSFGLTAGYDTAGYFSAFGACLSALAIHAVSRAGQRFRGFAVAYMLFAFSTLFTSRTAIALILAITLIASIVFFRLSQRSVKAFAVFLVGSIVLALVTYILPVFSTTLTVLQDIDFARSPDLIERFAVTDFTQWYETMWTIPDDSGSIIFGSGKDLPTTDVGYVQLLGRIGVIGLSATIAFYLYVWITSWRLAKHALGHTLGVGTRIMLRFGILSPPLLLIMNVKNLYFFSRGIHELVMIAFFVASYLATADLRPRVGARSRNDRPALVA